ncbi:hypothetical protein [Methylobacterium sp. Leaf118]|uniref:hypothetical protein n=1 Tax=Methylobacterium sp. Leaf118 TaxID=2876562 RepID=UPI001E4F7FB1|nr:hypothetical protein [Methylobacterium sp. Leaf118]
MIDHDHQGALGAETRTAALWSAWPEDDCDSDPRIDPMAQKTTEWFVGRWPNGADEPECRILIGGGRSAEIVARRIAEKLTSILSTGTIVGRKPSTPATNPGVPEEVRAGRPSDDALFAADAWLERLRKDEDTLGGQMLIDTARIAVRTLLAAHLAGQRGGETRADGRGEKKPLPPHIRASLDELLAMTSDDWMLLRAMEPELVARFASFLEASPAPTADRGRDAGGRFRVGRKVPRHVYEGDEPLFTMPTEEQAARLVDLLNAAPAPAGEHPGGWRWTVRDGLPISDAEFGERWLLTWCETSATYDIACITNEWGHLEPITLTGMDAWTWLAFSPGDPPAPPPAGEA